MENQFVPSELAVKLRDLGYDEECFAHYRSGNFDIVSDKLFIQYNNEFYSEYNKNSLLDGATAPLWQQAFDWFREQHNLHGDIYWTGSYYLIVIRDIVTGNSFDSNIGIDDYQEARQSCLQKLIILTELKP